MDERGERRPTKGKIISRRRPPNLNAAAGSHLVFYTDHFSLYVVVDENAQTEPDTPDTPDTPDAPAKESKVRNILHTIFAFLQKLIRLLTQK